VLIILAVVFILILVLVGRGLLLLLVVIIIVVVAGDNLAGFVGKNDGRPFRPWVRGAERAAGVVEDELAPAENRFGILEAAMVVSKRASPILKRPTRSLFTESYFPPSANSPNGIHLPSHLVERAHIPP
jgi:hypothetical protein